MSLKRAVTPLAIVVILSLAATGVACGATAASQTSRITTTTVVPAPPTATAVVSSSTSTIPAVAAVTSSESLPPSTDVAEPTPAASLAAETLANGLDMLQAGISWSYEPRGDVTGDIASEAWGPLVFVVITDVAPDGSHLTFDAVQRYVGLPLAANEAAKDGAKLDEGAPVYLRNKYKHPQMVPIAPDAGIILDPTDVGGDYDRSSLVDLGGDHNFLSATPAQFGQMFNGDPDRSASEVWLLIKNGKVAEIFAPYYE